ncbi:hypothetical protein [uncultured Tyzzerella sp.]|uniref:hypothetical protein n=1 Tax=uncultured Tyzzerella sp. TaxID=2321398 RepID=UPI00294388E3|nr:hypothetical protein [uncultured Tyzzerella sp.]
MKELEEIYNKINNLNYLLDRKIEILNIILSITKSQNVVFKEDKEVDCFIKMSLDEKQDLINELINIDDMFLSIFESFKGGLNKNKSIFKEDLIQIKDKIQQATDIDLKIRLQEEKNKNLINNNISLNSKSKVNILKVSKEEMLKKYRDNKKDMRL